MSARSSKGAQARTEAERARRHAARVAWHEGQIRRRVRDNVVAGVAGGLIVVGAVASQTVHAQVTAPVPEPTPTVSPSDAPRTPEPDATTPSMPTPTPTETPAP